MLLVACAARNGESTDDGACPAVMHFAEPVLTITRAVDPDGRDLPAVEIAGLRLGGRPALEELRHTVRDGRPFEPGTVTTDAGLYFGLTVAEDGRITCRVPCGFGSQTTLVRLSVAGPDGAGAVLRRQSTYASSLPICGGGAGDGTDVEVRLRAAPA